MNFCILSSAVSSPFCFLFRFYISCFCLLFWGIFLSFLCGFYLLIGGTLFALVLQDFCFLSFFLNFKFWNARSFQVPVYVHVVSLCALLWMWWCLIKCSVSLCKNGVDVCCCLVWWCCCCVVFFVFFVCLVLFCFASVSPIFLTLSLLLPHSLCDQLLSIPEHLWYGT